MLLAGEEKNCYLSLLRGKIQGDREEIYPTEKTLDTMYGLVARGVKG